MYCTVCGRTEMLLLKLELEMGIRIYNIHGIKVRFLYVLM